MKVNYFAETEGHSGVRIYSRKLKQSLEGKVELNHIRPKRVLKPEFFNKPLINPLQYAGTNSDLLHVTNQDDMAVPYFPDRKLVVTVHDIFPYVEDFSGPVYSAAAKLYVRQIEKYADRVIAISEFTKHQLLENMDINDDRIEVIYQGVDLEKFKPVEDEVKHDKYYLHVGSEINRKNIPGLIRIFSEIKEEQEDAVLVRVGHKTERIRNEIEEQGLELGEDVIYRTDISDEQLVALYSKAEKLLFPSHVEGFGRPMLESLACGTPVIAHDKRPMSEVLPDDMLVNEGNEEAFASKSVKERFEEDLCREVAEEYTWQKTSDQTVEVYRDLK